MRGRHSNKITISEHVATFSELCIIMTFVHVILLMTFGISKGYLQNGYKNEVVGRLIFIITKIQFWHAIIFKMAPIQ